uniref:Uncharacterized protein n=1 Tax=Manihot esculenta TaxID=3983 RepID=A0A2C9WGK4_MANES
MRKKGEETTSHERVFNQIPPRKTKISIALAVIANTTFHLYCFCCRSLEVRAVRSWNLSVRFPRKLKAYREGKTRKGKKILESQTHHHRLFFNSKFFLLFSGI